MNENIIMNPCSVESYPLLSKEMTLVQAATLGEYGIIKRRQLPKIFSRLQDIAKQATLIVEYIRDHHGVAFHRNYRFALQENPNYVILDIIVARMPHGSKKNQRLKVNLGYMQNPYWRIVFDGYGKMISCGEYSNQYMNTDSKKFNSFDDMCIQTRTYNRVVELFKDIFSDLSDEPVEIEMTKEHLDRIKRREEKKAAKKEKEKLARQKKREKEREKKYRSQTKTTKAKSYLLTRPDGSKVEVDEETYNKFKRLLANAHNR